MPWYHLEKEKKYSSIPLKIIAKAQASSGTPNFFSNFAGL
jgi:hypothetical protein